MKRFMLCLIVVCLTVSLLPTQTPASTNETSSFQRSLELHLMLGNPTDATQVPNWTNLLMVKPQFVLSYNHYKGGPNWVSWHLEAEDVGGAKRLNKFQPDNDLPAGFKRIVTGTYKYTGYERGHLCNSKDRTKTPQDNLATFAMTNILPQTYDLNKGPWLRLEEYSRQLAAAGYELYIIAGGYGSLGAIGLPNRRVNIPRVFWKVIVVLPRGNDDFYRIGPNTRTIAVCMPNRNGIPHDWQRYVATVRQVEYATKFNFNSKLSHAVQNAIETTKDLEARNRINPCQ